MSLKLKRLVPNQMLKNVCQEIRYKIFTQNDTFFFIQTQNIFFFIQTMKTEGLFFVPLTQKLNICWYMFFFDWWNTCDTLSFFFVAINSITLQGCRSTGRRERNCFSLKSFSIESSLFRPLRLQPCFYMIFVFFIEFEKKTHSHLHGLDFFILLHKRDMENMKHGQTYKTISCLCIVIMVLLVVSFYYYYFFFGLTCTTLYVFILHCLMTWFCNDMIRRWKIQFI
jgi:hypothetical protein